jgi:hypothetical protein
MRSKFMVLNSILFIIGFSLFSGCSSTKLVESWSDSSLETKPIKKILVLGFMETELQRRQYEDVFVEQLSQDGIIGVAGYTIMPNREDYDDKNKIRVAVQKTAVDAAMIARLVAIDEVTTVVPGNYEYQPSFGSGYGFYDYYGSSYQAMYAPGYTTTDTIVKLETTVFSTLTEEMIWAGTTRSFDPSSTESVATENADLIVRDMKKAGLM